MKSVYDIITIFPDIFNYLNYGVISRARDIEYSVNIWDLRDYADNHYKKVDDRPFGGGAGMILMPAPIAKIINLIKLDRPNSKIVYPSPQGMVFNNSMAIDLALNQDLVFICGRYDGIDERIIDKYVDLEISLGDYVVSGGELPTMVLLDAILRHKPNVIKNEASVKEDSFMNGLLKYPQYTRPTVFKGMAVPDVLLRGNHKHIAEWRTRQSIEQSRLKRPDLLPTNYKSKK